MIDNSVKEVLDNGKIYYNDYMYIDTESHEDMKRIVNALWHLAKLYGAKELKVNENTF